MIRELFKNFLSIPFLMLSLYVVFSYNAQETLLPTYIHSIIMYIMIGVTFVYSFLKLRLRLPVFSIWYLLFAFICLISVSFYIRSDDSMLYTIFVSFVISYCFLCDIDSPQKIDSIAIVYVFSAIIMALQIWYSGQLDRLLISSNINERLGSEISGNANIFSTSFMYAGVFSAWACLYSNSFRNKVIFMLCLCLILVFMALSGGRKTIVAVLAAIGVLYYFKSDFKDKRKVFTNVCIGIFVIIIIFYALFNVPFLYEHVGQRFEGLFDFFSGKGAEVSGDEIRSRIFVLAYEGWKENPFFGHGIDSFKFYNQSITGYFYYAHNNFVELLYDLGIIGFLVFYWIYFYLYKRLCALPPQLKKYKALGFGLMAELLIFDFGGVSYYLVGNVILLSIAFICSNQKLKQVRYESIG